MQGGFGDECDTELCLSPCTARKICRRSPNSGYSGRLAAQEEHSTKAQKNQQPITMVYDGRININDAAELQARAIINMAAQEMKFDKQNTKLNIDHHHTQSINKQGLNTAIENQQTETLHAFSMKKSLQQFLQKRKSRSFNSPYYHQHHQF